MKFRSIFAAALATMMLFTTCAGAVSLEQMQSVMPQIDVYVRDGDTPLQSLGPEEVTATLDGVPLKVELMEPSEQGIFYVFMLDISTSIKESYLAAAGQAVMNTYQNMGQNDQLALISFGNEVNMLLRGGESVDKVQAALDTIHSTDNNTRFYDAMNMLVDTASSQSDMRRVAVVVSDGEDDIESGMTREQLVDILHQSGVAVYAMAVDSAAPATIEQFREFIQVSGGDLVTFSPADADQKLAQLQDSIDEIWHLQLEAPSNNADGQPHELNIQFGELDSLSTEIRPTRWTPDDKPPYLLSTTPDAITGTVTLVFNEAMTNLNDPQYYTLKDADGNSVPFSLLSADSTTVVLQCDALKKPAGMSIEVTGPKDASMEANAMVSYSAQLASAEEPPADTTPVEPDTGNELMKLLLPSGGALLVIILLVVLLVVKSHQKSAPAAKPKKEKKEKQEKSATAKNPGVKFFFEDHEDPKS